MSYEEKSFWDLYGDYLEESKQRHRFAVLTLTSMVPTAERLLDLGCGKFQSADDLLVPRANYYGIDAFVPTKERLRSWSGAQLDYRVNFDNIADILTFPPDCFSSFFSSEITAPFGMNCALYYQLFANFPSLKWGLVSGFYYTDRKEENPVEETGGIKSYQTLEPIEHCSNGMYNETRLILPAPSTMFGPNVVEVWKLFVRKDNR